MMNIFDLVSDFYDQDEEWNSVLRQAYVEDFLRMKYWQGTDEETLMRLWDHITILCIYLANAEKFLGDLNREDIIDCVGWCGRNVSGFVVSVNNVSSFLDTLIDLYIYLQKKKIITNAQGPAEAKAKLIVNGQIQIIDNDGKILPLYQKSNLYSAPDLPAKIFLNIGEKLQNLLDSMQVFFGDKKYRRDVERATFLYGGTVLSGAIENMPDSDEYKQCFWDYFLFDYHLISDDKSPLQHFYEDICGNDFDEKGEGSKDVLLELLKSELVMFLVEEKSIEGFYNCRNILTGEQYFLTLPIDDDVDTKDFVFLGHIFYNKSMVMNFVRGMLMPLPVRKRFIEVMEKMRSWYAVRHGGNVSWQSFLRRNPVLIRHVSLLHAAYTRFEGFNYQSAFVGSNYQPQTENNDKVSQTIRAMMKPYYFSEHDISLTCRIWADYLYASKKSIDDFHVVDIWAAGIIKNFIELNAVYNYQDYQLSEICRSVPIEVIKNTASIIKKQLQIEIHDPRYVNEEGMLLMMLF